MYKKIWSYLSKLILWFTLLSIPLNGTVLAEPETGGDYNARAEHWLLVKLYNGEEADLAVRFSNPEDRRIRASFLVKLLDHPTDAISLYGVTIRNATVVGDLVFKNRDVEFPVYITGSTFEGRVELCNTHFYKYFSLQWGVFKSGVDFCGLKADEDICFAGAVFDSSLVFGYGEIGGSLVLDGSRYTNPQEEAKFGNIKVGHSLGLKGATFEGGADFGFAEIGQDLNLTEVRFNNKEALVKLYVAEVGNVITIKDAVFAGGVNFQSTRAGEISADNTQFLSQEQTVTFENVRADTMLINNAVFNGPVRFYGTQITRQFVGMGMQFLSKEQPVTFENFDTETIFLNNAIFNGPVSFYNAQTSGHFIGTGAQFLNADTVVSFAFVEVGKALYLDQTVFEGGADFSYATIGKDLNLIKTSFTNPEKEVWFGYVQVGNNFDFGEAIFEGKVYLGNVRAENYVLLNKVVINGPFDARFARVGLNFEAMDAQFNNVEVGTYFESMNVTDNLLINRSTFAGPADFSYILVNGFVGADDTLFEKPLSFSDANVNKHIYINRAVFKDSVNFTNTALWGFFADGADFPSEDGKIDVRGMTYERLYVVDAETKGEYLYLLDQSPYNGKMYKDLEEYYRIRGYPAYADHVYVSYKFRETIDGLKFTDWQWWWNWFLDIFIVFGKGPELAMFWFFMIIMFGWFMFRKQDKMVAKVETDRKYRPLIYSFDLFLPVINLGFADIWHPKPEDKIIKYYAVLHRWAGLILIPIAILAFLGIIK